MIGKILCTIGLHSVAVHQKYTPSIHADLVTAFDSVSSCRRCGKVISEEHWVWDAVTEEMIDKRPE